MSDDLVKFTQAVMDNVNAGILPEALDIDSMDLHPTVESDTTTSFTMSKWHDRVVPGRRGPGSRVPVGRVTYKVTIQRTYEPIEGE